MEIANHSKNSFLILKDIDAIDTKLNICTAGT